MIAPVSLQIVIERNVLMEKCLSSRSVGSYVKRSVPVQGKILASSDVRMFLGNLQ